MDRGDFVHLEMESEEIGAMVVLASPNDMSLMVAFEGMLGMYVGMMPLLMDDNGVYHDLLTHKPVAVTVIKAGGHC